MRAARKLISRLKPQCRRRLRRLSDRAAAAGRDAHGRAVDDPRAERRDGPRQQGAGRTVQAIAGGFLPEDGGAYAGQDRDDRQSGAPGRASRRPNMPYAPSRRERSVQSRRLRRQPGRAVLLQGHAVGDQPARRRSAQAAARSPSRRGRRTWTRSCELRRKLGHARRRSRPSSPTWRERIADAHLVICRSGASTVSELAVIGRPADPRALSACARP